MTTGITSSNASRKTKKYYTWKIGQINIQTWSDDQKLHLILLECCRANLDVIWVREVRLTKSGSVLHLNYDFYWCGMQRCKRNGVAIAIRNNPYICVNSIFSVSDRLIAADITINGCKLRIISCYAPTMNSSLSSKQSFYRELSRLLKVDKNRKVILQGDFNCEPEFCRTNSYFEGGKSCFEDGLNYDKEMQCYSWNFAIKINCLY